MRETQEALDIPAPEQEAPAAQALEKILEALLLASELPLSLDQLHRLLGTELGVGKDQLREGLNALAVALEGRAAELQEVASGFRIQVRKDYSDWVSKLWQEKPPKLSRALMETLALVCYRQPITRGEIEEVRGVALSPNIIRVLVERGWIREVGHKEVPGRPSLFGTTAQFLDDFSIKSLDELPSLPEIKDPAQLEAALAKLGDADAQAAVAEAAAEEGVEGGEEPSAEAPPDATVH
mgnify:CR=1 FL=1